MIQILMWLNSIAGYLMYLNDYLNNQILLLKNSLIDGYFIQFAFYDKQIERMIWIYDYNNLFYLIILWMDIHLSNVYKYLIPYGKMHLLSSNQVFVGSYMKDGKQQYEFGDFTESQGSAKFLYCVLDNAYDVTREFELFKSSILSNKSLTCKDVLNLLNLFFHRKYNVNDNSELKIVMDNTFTELTFKSKDMLI